MIGFAALDSPAYLVALLHYREGEFHAVRDILGPFVFDYQSYPQIECILVAMDDYLARNP